MTDRHGAFSPEAAELIALYPPRVRRMIAGDIGWYDPLGPLPSWERGPITERWLPSFDPPRPMLLGDIETQPGGLLGIAA